MTDDVLKVETEGLIENRWSNYFEYVWNIKNFSLIKAKFIESPEFQVKVHDDLTKWRLLLKPHEGEYCGVFLKFVHVKLNCALVECEFTLLNSGGSKIISRSFKHNDFDVEKWGYRSFIKRDELLNKISYDDNLLIISKITVSNDSNPIPQLMFSLTQGLHIIREKRDFSDVTFSVKNSKFYAHKVILAAQSPVFAAMFQNKMVEANSGEVTIEDIEPEVFEEFLKFIYTGNAKIRHNAVALFAASNKYDVAVLRKLCVKFLLKKLSHKNCFDTLLLADLHNDHELKRETINFIVSKGPKLDKKRLTEINDVSLLKELIEALGEKIQNHQNS